MVNTFTSLFMGFLKGMLTIPQFFYTLITGGSVTEYSFDLLQTINSTGSWITWGIGTGCGALCIAILLYKPVALVINLINPLS